MRYQPEVSYPSIESLESRQMLAADLSVAIASPAAGATLGYGVEQRVIVMAANAGSSTPDRARVNISLFASTDGTFDAASDILLASRSVSRISGGETESKDLEFVVSRDIAAGEYTLFAVIDPMNEIAESNETNNVSAGVVVRLGDGTSPGGGGGSDDGPGHDSGGDNSGGGSGGGSDDGPGHDSGGDNSGGGSGGGSDDGPGHDSGGDHSGGGSGGGSDDGPGHDSGGDNSGGGSGGGSDDGPGHDSGGDNSGGGSGGGSDDGPGHDSGGDHSGGGDGGGTGGVNTSPLADLSVSVERPLITLTPNTEARMFITVANGGNSRARNFTVELFVARAGAGADPATDLKLGSRRISTLNPGERETEDIEFRVPASLAGQDVRIYAVIDSGNAIAESNEGNNISDLTGAMVDGVTRDVSASVVSATLPSSVTEGEKSRDKAVVRYSLSNMGNQSFSSRDKATVQAYLRRVGSTDDSGDIAVSSVRRESLRSLTPGDSSRGRDVRLKLPTNLTAGEYTIILKIDDGFALGDEDRSNNTIFTGSSLTVNPAVVDLALEPARIVSATDVAAGAKISVSGAIRNMGNVRTKGSVSVEYFLRDADGHEVSIGGTSKGFDLKTDKVKRLDRVRLVANAEAGTYTLVMRIVESPQGTDADEGIRMNDSIDVGQLTIR